MPRPRKCRRVCRLPSNTGFRPERETPGAEPVVLNVDEYETIRLIDGEGFSQEQCGAYMKIARTTVQQIYTSARKKLAQVLVDGLPLQIRGGDYMLCDGAEEFCGCGGCCRFRNPNRTNREERTMKIAIPLDEEQKNVCVSFGRAPYFLFAQDGKTEILENPAADAEGGSGIQAAQFVADHGATVLITVRCGQNAAQVFQAADIKIYHSGEASAQDNLEAFAQGKLEELTHFHAGYQGIQ